MSTETYNILVTAASGNVGVPLVRQLLEAKPSTPYRMVLVTRDRTRLLAKLPPAASSSANVIIEEGDIASPSWLEGILRKNAVAAAILNFTGPDELFLTFNTFDALRRAGSVKHIVYVSAAGDFSPQAVLNGGLRHVDAAHVAVKFPVEQKLAYGDLPFTWTVLGPTMFFTNDLRPNMKAAMLTKDAGEAHLDAPIPLKDGNSRVDTEDIARAAINAIEDRGRKWAGKKVVIGSRELYTAYDTARLWSEALGREIKASPDLNSLEYLDKCEETLVKVNKSPSMGRPYTVMFWNFYSQPFYVQTDEEYREQVELLGKQPSSYPEFVKKNGELWRQEIKG